MKKNVLKKIRNIVCVMLAVACMASIPSLEADAESNIYENEESEELTVAIVEVPDGIFDNSPNTRAVLSHRKIILDFNRGVMDISFYTGASDFCPVLGVKDIKVEKKVWYGWKEVAYADGGEVTDSISMGLSVVYENAEKDETYRVSCVHYADLTYDGIENYTEVPHTTEEFVFTY